MEPFETYEHVGLTIELHPDLDYGDYCNPRDWENLGIMVCWHPNYYLGDFQITSPDGRGAVKERFHRDDFESFEQFARYLSLMDEATCILPLTVYEHSGITMYVGRKYDFPFDSAGWDTTETGFIYTTPEKIAAIGAENFSEEEIERQLRVEVRLYAAYLEGNVIGFVVKDGDEVVDSCWGFLDDYDYCKKEAESAAEYYLKEKLINQEPTDIAEVLAK